MFSKKGALPPRHLIALIVGITVVPLGTLLWLGWRLLEQDRILEGQQEQQRLDRAADLGVAALQRALSASQQRLAAGSEDWPENAVAIAFRNGRVEAHPKERVAYLPVVPPLREALSSAFMRGDDLEFREPDRAAAIDFFREAAKSPDPAVRAGALLRLGRNLSSAGRTQEALATYAQLSAIDDAGIGGTPAGLIGQYAICKLLEREKRGAELITEARRLANALHSVRWSLTGPVYGLYAGDAARWAGAQGLPPSQSEVFAGAADALWERTRSASASWQETLTIDGEHLVVLGQTSGDSVRALIAAPQFVQSEWLAAIAPVAKEQAVVFELRDSEGRDVFGTAQSDVTAKAVRNARDAELPWSVAVQSISPSGQDSGFALRRRLLTAGLALLVFMAVAASYLIFRAVGRELAVARLQSDFVAAVSHEFRTPLTALRQFTDMLREHPGLGDDRRQICYDAQARAAERLTRLVESLLDFGRMEAGAHKYRFESRDCTDLVRRVVEDFRGEARSAGYEVEFHGNGLGQIETDSEALSRAVWNLLDNAVKYSPDHRTVAIGLDRRDDDILIAVRDHGIGIPAHERATIFSKFQRGEHARTRGIRGTGIGLTIVDEIVKAHHGRVELESEPGKGSTFTIVLPAKD